MSEYSIDIAMEFLNTNIASEINHFKQSVIQCYTTYGNNEQFEEHLIQQMEHLSSRILYEVDEFKNHVTVINNTNTASIQKAGYTIQLLNTTMEIISSLNSNEVPT